MKILWLKPIFLSILFFGLFLNPVSSTQITHLSITDNQPHTSLYSQNYEEFVGNDIEPQQECNIIPDYLQRGAAKDAIRSIDNPQFVNPEHVGAPDDPKQKVIGIVINGTARAYPYNILNWHEIVNDDFNGNSISVTYCPLTGSGILYPTSIINDTELGVSGLLFENNLVFYERDRGTHWSQMGGFTVKGRRGGIDIAYIENIETTWETWLKLHPDSKVLSAENDPAPVDRYPYGAYRTDGSIYFKTTFNEKLEPYNLYHEKELTHIVRFEDKTLLLPFEELSKIPILNHNFGKTTLKSK